MDEYESSHNVLFPAEEDLPSGHRPIILNRRFSSARKSTDSALSVSTSTDTSHVGILPQGNLLYSTGNAETMFYPCMSELNYRSVNTSFSTVDTSQLAPTSAATLFYKEPQFLQTSTSIGSLHNTPEPCTYIQQQDINKSYQGNLVPIFKQQDTCTKGCNSLSACLGKRKADIIFSGNPFQSVPLQRGPRDKENVSFRSSLPLRADTTSWGEPSQVLVTSRPVLNEIADAGSKESAMNDSLTTMTWLGHMDAHKLMPCASVRPTTIRNLERGRPPYSYMALIQFAINSSPVRRMTLKQIYSWIEETFPYFKHAKPGWKNSIRHNLSLHDIFLREVSTSSKSSYWTLRPDLNQRPLTLEYITRMNGVPLHQFQCFESSPGPDIMQGGFNYQEEIQPRVLMPASVKDSFGVQNIMPYAPILAPSMSKQIKQEPVEVDIPSFQLDKQHWELAGKNLNLSLLSDPQSDALPLENFVERDKENNPEVRKRRRKQPLKTLNDSLNDSLHFADHSPLMSPKSMEQVPDAKEKIYDLNSSIKFEVPECVYGGTDRNECSEPFLMSESILNPQQNEGCELFIKKENPDDNESYSRTQISGRESPLEECLPQIFGGDAFAFNSSFNKFLNASGISLFNLSDRSADFDDANWPNTLDSVK